MNLRHPVVITSLEEDFRKIGLIKVDDHDEDDSLQEGLMESDNADDFEEFEDDVEVDEDLEDDDFEEDVENDDDSALAEAVAFNENFASSWKSLGEDGVETIYIAEAEMAEMEAMAEEVVELPAGVLPNVIDEDDDEIDESDDESDESDEDAGEFDVDAEVEGDGSAFESVAEALRTVEAMMEGPNGTVAGPAEAIPAFANMALIAEKLYGFFAETAEVQEDDEYSEISEAYRAIGKYSAGIVDTLQTEDPDSIDMEVLGETFQSYLGTILEGLETYAILHEADDEDGEDYDEDGEDYDEDDEGNA